MKKPKYVSELYAFIFLLLALGFMFSACLSFANIIKVTEHSLVQNQVLSGQIFCILGTIFFIIQGVFRYISKKQRKMHNELIKAGRQITASIEKVSLRKDIKFGKESPYILNYTYSYEDEIYHSKSHLLWDKANISEGDRISICVDDMGKSTIEL